MRELLGEALADRGSGTAQKCEQALALATLAAFLSYLTFGPHPPVSLCLSVLQSFPLISSKNFSMCSWKLGADSRGTHLVHGCLQALMLMSKVWKDSNDSEQRL